MCVNFILTTLPPPLSHSYCSCSRRPSHVHRRILRRLNLLHLLLAELGLHTFGRGGELGDGVGGSVVTEESGRVRKLDRLGIDVVPVARLVPGVAHPVEVERSVTKVSYCSRKKLDSLLAQKLRFPHSIVANVLVGAKSQRNVAFARESQHLSNSCSVFHALTGALDGGGEEGVGGIAEKSDSALRRDPSREGITVDELPVEKTVYGELRVSECHISHCSPTHQPE